MAIIHPIFWSFLELFHVLKLAWRGKLDLVCVMDLVCM
jgi:hypothetical protein